MSKQLFLLAVVSIGVLALSGYNAEEGVYVLTDSNFDEFVSSRPYVLVEFYAPWCGHCQKLTPEYVKAARTLSSEKSSVVLAKVDSTEQKEITSRFNIQGFPSLKFFTGSVDNPVDFNGGRTDKDILTWIKKRTGAVTEVLSSSEDIAAFIAKHLVAVVYYGNLNNLFLPKLA